jgi:carbonic anhydrase
VAATVATLRPATPLPVRLPAAWQAGWLGQGAPPPGELEAVLASVRPGLAGPWDTYDEAVRANVRYGVRALQRSPLVAARVYDGTLAVVGAHYALESGRVTVIQAE